MRFDEHSIDDRGSRRHRHGARGGNFGPGFGGPDGPFGPGAPFGRGGRGGRGGFGPEAGFGPGGRGGRRRRRGDVRLALLLLLSQGGPANGYQLMQGLQQRSDGRWRPSPGSVYPALSQLEDEGLIRSTEREGETGRTFELTDAGSAHLADHGPERAPWEPEGDEADNAGFTAFRNAGVGLAKASWQIAHEGDEELLAKATEILDESRKRLYRLLAGDAE